MTRITAAAVAILALAGCSFIGADWQHSETEIGENAYRLEYSQMYANKMHADGTLSIFAKEKCPSGWRTDKEYQKKGPGYPIWVWEISCLE